jgi:hypothetical protein
MVLQNRICDNNLFENKYDLNILENNIDHLDIKIVLFTQKLTADFCVKYIFNPDIDSGSEDSYIFDKCYILAEQPHITEEEFDKVYRLHYSDDPD